MPPELLQTALIDVLEHAGGASRDLPAFLQTFDLTLAVGLGLTEHEVVIVRLAAGANKEGCAQQGGGGGANLRHARDGGGKGSGVDEDLLVEAFVDASAGDKLREAEGWRDVGVRSLPRLSRRHGGRICASNGRPGDVEVVGTWIEDTRRSEPGREDPSAGPCNLWELEMLLIQQRELRGRDSIRTVKHTLAIEGDIYTKPTRLLSTDP